MGFDGQIGKNDVIDKALDVDSPEEVEVIKVGNMDALLDIGELRFGPGNVHRIGQPIVVPPKCDHGRRHFAGVVKRRSLLPVAVEVAQPSKVVMRVISYICNIIFN